MAKSGMEIIDVETGAIINDVIFKLNDELYDPNDIGFKGAFDFKNNEAKKQNIRVYRVSEPAIDAIELEHPDYGEYHHNIKKGCKFSKLYQNEDPCFDKDSYYKYWHKLCCSVDQNTNVIYNRNPTLHKVNKISELEELCEGSHASISKFIKECISKGLIAEFRLKGKKEFVVNPKYVLNGKKMPILLYNLFNEEDVNDNYDTNE